MKKKKYNKQIKWHGDVMGILEYFTINLTNNFNKLYVKTVK